MKTVKDMDTFRFHDYVEQAIGHLQEAEGQISYLSFPDVNKDTIAKLKRVFDLLDDVLDADIYKLQKD